jgi:two-component system cell cycle sensor histidine kinase/response regulator CckA
VSTLAESPEVRNCKLFSRAASASGVLVSGFALLGWLLGIPALQSVSPGLPTMRPITALCFALAGLSLWLLQLQSGELSNLRVRRAYAARVLSGVVGLIGLLTLAEYLFHLHLGIDEFLFHGTLVATGVVDPGRMAGATALGFLLLGGSLVLTTNRTSYLAQSLALLASLNGFVACVGYLLGARSLYDIPPYSAMALHTAILFLVMGLGALAARPELGIMAAITNEYMGGVMTRRMLPLVIVVPIFLGWLRWRGQLAGLYGSEFGIALRTLAEVVTFAAFLWVCATWLNRVDQQRRETGRRDSRLTTILESSDDAIFSADLLGMITTWNQGAERLFGYASSEIIGKPVTTLAPPELQEEARQLLKEATTGQRMASRDETVRRSKDGSLVHVSLIIAPLRNVEGQIVGVSGIAHDITGRKGAETALRASQAQLSGIVNSAMDSIITVDRDQHIVQFNPAAEKMFGYSTQEMVGQPLERLVPERFRQAHAQHVNTFSQTGTTRRRMGELGNLSGLRANGQEFPIEASISVTSLPGEQYLTVILRDITERRQAEEALRRSEEEFRTMANAIPHLAWMANPDGGIFWYNQGWYDYTGTAPQQMESLSWQSAIDPALSPRVMARWQDSIVAGQPFEMVVSLRGAHGEFRAFLTRVSPIKDPLGNVLRWFGTNTDVEESKRAEEELARSRQALEDKTLMLESVLSSMSEGLVAADEHGKFILWNPAAERIVGLGPANVPSDEWSDHYGVFLPDKVTPLLPEKNPLARAIQGEASTVVMFVRNPEIREGVFVEAHANPLKDKNGTLRGGVAAFRDITKHMRTEERLREYERVVEGLEEMIVVMDRDYRYVIANRAFLQYRDMTSEQVVGHRVDEVVNKEVFESLLKGKMDECFRGKVVQYELKYEYPRLGERDLFASYFPIEGPTGIDRIACVLRDITERKRGEEALRQAEQKYRTIFEEAVVGIFQSDLAGHYLNVNPAMARLLGYASPQELVASITDISQQVYADPESRDAFRLMIDREGIVQNVDCQVCRKDGSKIWISVNARPVRENGVLVGYEGTNTDITERKLLEQQLLQAQKMEAVGRLAGGVAHDFNNMLGVIMGYSDLSLGVMTPDSPSYKHLTQIKKASQRAALLTRQLLAFSRQQVVFPKVLDLNEVVHNVTSMLLRMVGEDVDIAFRPATPIGCIKADRGQIEQVLMNLVINARDAMPTGGEIVIQTENAELDEDFVFEHRGSGAGPHVVLKVRDTGCGMDETVQSKIFEPFFTTKEVGVGTGLGLSTVYGIVKQSGGYIVVESAPGKGTTFEIYFPRVADKAEPLLTSPEEAVVPGGSETILVVEDDASLRELTVHMLTDAGYRVLEAKDAETALGVLQHPDTVIDLLLTDVIMPGKDGLQLLEQAKVVHPNLLALFMSGYLGNLRTRLVAQGAFLEKPFTMRSLLTKVRSVLHGESAKGQAH